MITDTRDQILEEIEHQGQTRVYDLVKILNLSRVAIHKQLRRLLKEKLIIRVGKPPLVFYKFPLGETFKSTKTDQLSDYAKRIIQENFLYITPSGDLLYGNMGFEYWANIYQKNKSFTTVASEYIKVFKEEHKKFSKDGWIEATSKLDSSFGEVFVNRLLFADIYSYKIFGRTKMAKLVMYAKQVGSRELIDQITQIVRPIIKRIIVKYNIDAVGYIPPTVPRPIQFMTEFSSKLNLLLPEVKLVKVIPGKIPIPQKTLSGIEERIVNARDSIYSKNKNEISYDNVLLIDDVVGSGASFNETAKKLKTVWAGIKNIIAFAIVGNIKGYEIIREI